MIDTEALRKKIIDLAIQGKLTEHLPSDGDAETLYAQILDEKNEIIKTRGGRQDKFIKTEDDEKPFDIPSNWKWIRFGEIGLFKKGPFGSALTKSMFVPKSDDVIKIYEQQHAIKKDASLGTYYISREYFEKNMSGFEVKSGDIIVSCAGTIGETYVMPPKIEQGIINQALMRVTLVSNILNEFFLYYFDSNLKRNARNESNGMAIKNIPPFDVMKNWYFPLPPIAEQRRIVEKLDTLLAQIDIIDTLQQQYESDLAVLKRKIIDAGIRGKLTEQLPEDGNAETLYLQIQEEKAKLIKEGKIKKEKPLPEIDAEEIPFEIPKNWKWVRINDIGSWSSGATPSRGNKDYYINGIYPWIKTGELNDGYIDDAEEYISELALRECSVRLNPIGSVLVAMYGATIGKVGILDIEATTNQACCACIPIKINNKFLYYFLMSNKVKFLESSHGGAQPNISKDIITKSLMPLPTLKEQERIIKKLDEVLLFCL